MTPFLLWVLIVLVSLAACAWRLGLKYAIGPCKVSPETVFCIVSLVWFLVAIVVGFLRRRVFTKAIADDVTNIQTRWPGIAVIIVTAAIFSVFAYIFYYLVIDNQACTLFPVRSAIVLVLTVIGGIVLFSERLRGLQGVAIALFGVGVGVMIVDSVVNSGQNGSKII